MFDISEKPLVELLRELPLDDCDIFLTGELYLLLCLIVEPTELLVSLSFSSSAVLGSTITVLLTI